MHRSDAQNRTALPRQSTPKGVIIAPRFGEYAMNMRRFPVLMAGPLLIAALAFSQQPSTESTAQPVSPSNNSTFQITSNLVVLDVVVTDKNGAIVKDLSKDDFRIYENNVLQTVHSFEHY